MLRRRFVATVSLLVALPPAANLLAPLAVRQDVIVVYLVRHAERDENGTSDPPLSAAGRARARLLADMLRDAGITAVHTTDYIRTRSTAQPLADALGLRPAVYDPDDLEGFAAQLRNAPGRHLVVGHSDTTPPLVAELGGDPGSAIAEMEYDRLYIVTLTDGSASTILLRFGAPYAG